MYVYVYIYIYVHMYKYMCIYIYIHVFTCVHIGVIYSSLSALQAENYIRWIPMCGDGLFWAAKWEVAYDAWGSVKRGKRTDQLIQRADSVELTALWLSAFGSATMADGTPVQCQWHPSREANPNSNKARCRASNGLMPMPPKREKKEPLPLCDKAGPGVEQPRPQPREVPKETHLWPTLGEAKNIERDAAIAKKLERHCSDAFSPVTSSSSSGGAVSDPVRGDVPTRRWGGQKPTAQ